MLILTRKVDQAIRIGDDTNNAMVRVLGIERDRVKLGIGADENVLILREELLEKPLPEGQRPSHEGEEPIGRRL
jgi:carbon storage regulator CsrA